MAFVPPLYSNLGKSASDLFKKKFDDKKDFKNVIKTVNKTASGLVLTTGGEFDSKNNLTGALKGVFKKDTIGDFTGELSTAGPAKLEVKLKKLAKGLTVTIVGDTAPAYAPAPKAGAKAAKFTNPTIKTTAEYTQDFFAGAASVETSFTATNVIVGSAVIGFEGLSVGGEVKVDTAAIKDIEDYNVGAEYQGADFTATLKTANSTEDLTAQYIQKVNADVQVGGAFQTKLNGDDDKSLGAVTEIKVDGNTTLKLRADTKKVAALAVETRLSNPKLKVGLASSWSLTGFALPNPKDFGVSLVFGDYDSE